MALKEYPTIDDVKNYYEKFVNYRHSTEGNSRVKQILKFIDSRIKYKNYQSALDIGCGAGIITEHLKKSIHTVIGIDISEERIKLADSRGTAIYYQDDYSRDNIAIQKCDLVIVCDCLEHILPERRKTFLKNVYNSFNEMVIVTIPEPNNLKHLRETRPEILQIVDEPIYDEDFDKFIIKEKITKGIYVYYVLGK